MKFEKIKELLSKYKIGIAGCGGLGSNCAVSLVRVGIKDIVISDFDVVEESNLNRQYYFYDQLGKYKVAALEENMLRINSEIKIEKHNLKLNEENIVDIFKECDIIIEAFDKAEMKVMIIETVLSNYPDKPLISGNGMAGFGKNDLIKIENYDNLYIVGDGVTEVSEEEPPLSPRVNIVAHTMANIVLEILLKEKKK